MITQAKCPPNILPLCFAIYFFFSYLWLTNYIFVLDNGHKKLIVKKLSWKNMSEQWSKFGEGDFWVYKIDFLGIYFNIEFFWRGLP